MAPDLGLLCASAVPIWVSSRGFLATISCFSDSGEFRISIACCFCFIDAICFIKSARFVALSVLVLVFCALVFYGLVSFFIYSLLAPIFWPCIVVFLRSLVDYETINFLKPDLSLTVCLCSVWAVDSCSMLPVVTPLGLARLPWFWYVLWFSVSVALNMVVLLVILKPKAALLRDFFLLICLGMLKEAVEFWLGGWPKSEGSVYCWGPGKVILVLSCSSIFRSP